MSQYLLVTINPGDIAMFRFLLEAHENLALFTVLERHTALLKIAFSPESLDKVVNFLTSINQDIPLVWEPWPLDR